MCESILEHCSKLHRFVKGGCAPDTLMSKDIGGIDTDPSRLLESISKEWSFIWRCDDPSKRAAAVARCTKAKVFLFGLTACLAKSGENLI